MNIKDKGEATDIISEKLGHRVENGHYRMVINKTIGVFQSEIEKARKHKCPFYFIPIVEIRGGGNKTYVLLEERLQVFEVPYELMDSFHEGSVNRLTMKGYVKWVVPLDQCIKKYDEAAVRAAVSRETISDEELDLEFNPDDGDIPYSKLTARDHACIQLKLPNSKKQWLNDLIELATRRSKEWKQNRSHGSSAD